MTKPDDQEKPDKHWTIERKIPVAIIVTFIATILIQTFAFGWWGSSMAARVEQLEKDRDAAKILVVPQGERLTRLEVDITYIKEGLNEIKQILRKQ